MSYPFFSKILQKLKNVTHKRVAFNYLGLVKPAVIRAYALRMNFSAFSVEFVFIYAQNSCLPIKKNYCRNELANWEFLHFC